MKIPQDPNYANALAFYSEAMQFKFHKLQSKS